MNTELVYTSVPKGLLLNTYGYCVAAATEKMSPALLRELSALSKYDYYFKLSDARFPENPPNFAYTILPLQEVHVLSRICACPADYSGRVNFIAHHFTIDDVQNHPGGPGALIRVLRQRFRTEYQDPPAHLSPPVLPNTPNGEIRLDAWRDAGLEVGFAGLLAAAAMDNPKCPSFFLYTPGQDVLGLFRDALTLIPESFRWKVTFSTYHTSGVSYYYMWRGIIAGSGAAETAMVKYPNSLVIDLTKPAAEAPDTPDAQAARNGRPLPKRVGAAEETSTVPVTPARQRLRVKSAAPQTGGEEIPEPADWITEFPDAQPAYVVRPAKKERKIWSYLMVGSVVAVLLAAAGIYYFYSDFGQPPMQDFSDKTKPGKTDSTPTTSPRTIPSTKTFITRAQDEEIRSLMDRAQGRFEVFKKVSFKKHHSGWSKEVKGLLTSNKEKYESKTAEGFDAIRWNCNKAEKILSQIESLQQAKNKATDAKTRADAAYAVLKKMPGLDKKKDDKYKNLEAKKTQAGKKLETEEKFKEAETLYEEVCRMAEGIEERLAKEASKPEPKTTPKEDAKTKEKDNPSLAMNKGLLNRDNYKIFYPKRVFPNEEQWKAAQKAVKEMGVEIPGWVDHITSSEHDFMYCYKIGKPKGMYIQSEKSSGLSGGEKSENSYSESWAGGWGRLFKREKNSISKKYLMLVFVSPVQPEKSISSLEWYVWFVLNKKEQFSEKQYTSTRQRVYCFFDNQRNLYICCPNQRVIRGTISLNVQENIKSVKTIEMDNPKDVILKLMKDRSEIMSCQVKNRWEYCNDKVKLVATPMGKKISLRLELNGPGKTLAERLKGLENKSTEEILKVMDALAEIHESKLQAFNEYGIPIAEMSLKVMICPGDAPAIALPLQEKETYSATKELPPHLAKTKVHISYAPPRCIQPFRMVEKRRKYYIPTPKSITGGYTVPVLGFGAFETYRTGNILTLAWKIEPRGHMEKLNLSEKPLLEALQDLKKLVDSESITTKNELGDIRKNIQNEKNRIGAFEKELKVRKAKQNRDRMEKGLESAKQKVKQLDKSEAEKREQSVKKETQLEKICETMRVISPIHWKQENGTWKMIRKIEKIEWSNRTFPLECHLLIGDSVLLRVYPVLSESEKKTKNKP